MNNDRFKFRVWDNNQNEYRQDNVTLCKDGCPYIILGGYWFYEHNCIIEQCTGLRDKNGKLIYEGDVVLFVGKVNLAVQYTPNEWEMAGDDVNVPLTENTARFVKIVGNIHFWGIK